MGKNEMSESPTPLDPKHEETPEGNRPIRESWRHYSYRQQVAMWVAVAALPFLAVSFETYLGVTTPIRFGLGFIAVQVFFGVLLVLKASYEIGFLTARLRFHGDKGDQA